ncbi:hypothetical protein Agub_g10741 [Astrephomene gubernaculifera]|uniref:BZIP domain-containing protein n=1 Tax=Astrephomene gubernaculifera TaxID=47775 RepID=A0AAD3DVU1_9CHLO|nr:hypothetical protein Agub_g10741 [Astrephomene gubernaculifera]
MDADADNHALDTEQASCLPPCGLSISPEEEHGNFLPTSVRYTPGSGPAVYPPLRHWPGRPPPNQPYRAVAHRHPYFPAPYRHPRGMPPYGVAMHPYPAAPPMIARRVLVGFPGHHPSHPPHTVQRPLLSSLSLPTPPYGMPLDDDATPMPPRGFQSPFLGPDAQAALTAGMTTGESDSGAPPDPLAQNPSTGGGGGGTTEAGGGGRHGASSSDGGATSAVSGGGTPSAATAAAAMATNLRPAHYSLPPPPTYGVPYGMPYRSRHMMYGYPPPHYYHPEDVPPVYSRRLTNSQHHSMSMPHLGFGAPLTRHSSVASALAAAAPGAGIAGVAPSPAGMIGGAFPNVHGSVAALDLPSMQTTQPQAACERSTVPAFPASGPSYGIMYDEFAAKAPYNGGMSLQHSFASAHSMAVPPTPLAHGAMPGSDDDRPAAMHTPFQSSYSAAAAAATPHVQPYPYSLHPSDPPTVPYHHHHHHHNAIDPLRRAFSADAHTTLSYLQPNPNSPPNANPTTAPHHHLLPPPLPSAPSAPAAPSCSTSLATATAAAAALPSSGDPGLQLPEQLLMEQLAGCGPLGGASDREEEELLQAELNGLIGDLAEGYGLTAQSPPPPQLAAGQAAAGSLLHQQHQHQPLVALPPPAATQSWQQQQQQHSQLGLMGHQQQQPVHLHAFGTGLSSGPVMVLEPPHSQQHHPLHDRLMMASTSAPGVRLRVPRPMGRCMENAAPYAVGLPQPEISPIGALGSPTAMGAGVAADLPARNSLESQPCDHLPRQNSFATSMHTETQHFTPAEGNCITQQRPRMAGAPMAPAESDSLHAYTRWSRGDGGSCATALQPPLPAVFGLSRHPPAHPSFPQAAHQLLHPLASFPLQDPEQHRQQDQQQQHEEVEELLPPPQQQKQELYLEPQQQQLQQQGQVKAGGRPRAVSARGRRGPKRQTGWKEDGEDVPLAMPQMDVFWSSGTSVGAGEEGGEGVEGEEEPQLEEFMEVGEERGVREDEAEGLMEVYDNGMDEEDDDDEGLDEETPRKRRQQQQQRRRRRKMAAGRLGQRRAAAVAAADAVADAAAAAAEAAAGTAGFAGGDIGSADAEGLQEGGGDQGAAAGGSGSGASGDEEQAGTGPHATIEELLSHSAERVGDLEVLGDLEPQTVSALLEKVQRKGKGGRAPAEDPRLDPSIDPRKARRILANRISAARSKLKQKLILEGLKARYQQLLSSKTEYQSELAELRAACKELENRNRGLAGKLKDIVREPLAQHA